MNTAGHFHDNTSRAFRTLWSWLRRMATHVPSRVDNEKTRTLEATAPVKAKPLVAGKLLPFPIRGEALLVKLAQQLRRRVDELAPTSSRLSLTLTHQPYLRLLIDGDSYVEFDTTSSQFELVMEAPGGTRLILQTLDFDAVVKFVLQYVSERLADDVRLEVAS
jgi:hypothetical protein